VLGVIDQFSLLDLEAIDEVPMPVFTTEWKTCQTNQKQDEPTGTALPTIMVCLLIDRPRAKTNVWAHRL
jgi:hypothetical protein